jgi:hypothetical protein
MPAQRAAIAHRNVLELIAAGGNVYYLAKFAGIFGLDVQDHRRAADRHDARKHSRRSSPPRQGIDHGHHHRRHHHVAHPVDRPRDREEPAGGPYWKPFFDGYPPVHDWLRRREPDVAVVFYNDHGLNFFLDKMPTFAIGAAPRVRNADEGWGIPTLPPFSGDVDLSWHLIERWSDRTSTSPPARKCWSTMRSRCRSSCCGRRRPVPGAHRADLHQHGPASDAVARSAATTWAGRVGDAIADWQSERAWSSSAPAAVAPARRRARRLHQQGVRLRIHGQLVDDPEWATAIRYRSWSS